MAAFMEVLDTSIANVALPHIAGNLGASNDESTWVLTSYLVSNAIVLPISGWLATLFGRKRFFLLCIFLFTLSSLLCGAAPNLGALILFRVLQGAGGGGLQPMAQAILADTFPPQKRGLAFALYGITAIMAPTIGPTLGGWITDNYTWRWIFYINLPVGILTLFLVMRMVEDPPYLRRVKGAGIRVDYIGIALLAIGIGALQAVPTDRHHLAAQVRCVHKCSALEDVDRISASSRADLQDSFALGRLQNIHHLSTLRRFIAQ